jgi:DNA-directed RNA polymerase subunit beta'
LAKITETVSFGKETKGKQRRVITDLDGNAHEFRIAKEKNVLVHNGHVVNKGEMIVDGPADPFAFASLGYRSSGPLSSLTKCRTCIAYKA